MAHARRLCAFCNRVFVPPGKADERILYCYRAAVRAWALKKPMHDEPVANHWTPDQRSGGRAGGGPEIVAERKAIVEHVFGILRLWGHDTFLMKGLEKVRAEFSRSAPTRNLRRALNLRRVSKLLQVRPKGEVGSAASARSKGPPGFFCGSVGDGRRGDCPPAKPWLAARGFDGPSPVVATVRAIEKVFTQSV